jgi:elongation factor 2
MTVKAANVSLYHEWRGKPYVINLVDTPGHVDFTGHVTRSLRIMDGGLVVCDAVEGVMTQTETVLRQALEERVRPLLFINKVDRLIKELKLSPSEIQQRFVEIVKDFNNLIELYAEPEFKKVWKVDFAKGQVAFGSALHKWGLTVPIAQGKGFKFSNIIDAYERNYVDDLAKEAPLYEALLDMVVEHVPNPIVAQRYRIPKLWKGELDSEVGKAMLDCDYEGPTVVCVSKVVSDPHAGLVATGRVFSGTVYTGEDVYLVMAREEAKIQQTGLYMGPYREACDNITAGNIVAMLGLEKARAGETVTSLSMKGVMIPFERLRYISEPVVTMAIEPKSTADLPKLVDALRRMAIEDPTLHVKINEETGEYLIAGMGQLHLEIALWDLQQRTGGLEVVTSPPIVVYRETIRKAAGPFEGKSPNKHNRVYVKVEPLSKETMELLERGEIYDGQDWRARAKILREKAGWDSDEARNIWAIDEHLNIFVDASRGLQHLREVKDTLIAGFTWTVSEGPLCREPMRGVKVVLVDAQIHEDPAHRGPAQMMPALKDAIMCSFLSAKPTLLEPIVRIEAKCPPDYISGLTKVVVTRRGRILDLSSSGMLMALKGEMPVAETFDLANEIRSATAGRAFWALEVRGWEAVPEGMLHQVVMKVRERKGLPKEIPKPEDFMPR